MFVACTTVARREDADRLAASAVTQRLAACVQIDGPVTSHFVWEGRQSAEQEFRLSFKVVPEGLAALERHVLKEHPYDTPEWIVLRAEHVGEKYLSWARANSSSSPL
jgi:periplasmic divalent cation tolerance protein